MTPPIIIRLLMAVAVASAACSDRHPQVKQSEETKIRHHKPRSRRYYQGGGWNTQQLPNQESYMWKPAVYQLTRPYFIPVFGAPGETPIYYPPQPLLRNPGTPKDNPVPYKGPKYLPPSEGDKNKDVKFDDRFNFDEDDEQPIWSDPASSMGRPLQSGGSDKTSEPTRAPKPKEATAFPPLVHDSRPSGTNHLSAGEPAEEEAAQPRPPPPVAPPTGSDKAPPPQAQVAAPRLSNCAWAIVACCSAESSAAPVGCFEERGCAGPFWGASPCDSDFAKKALEAVLNYYASQAR